MDTKNTHQQETNKKQWLPPVLKVYGDVVEITAEMLGGGKSAVISNS